MTRFVAALIALLLAGAAAAQNVTVIGPVTPGNVPIFNSTTVIKDSGTAPGGTQTVNWINVKTTCAATGNGSTDDTAAINTCIGLFNTATNGVLYFPAGTYKTTAALTAVTANGIIRGDGMESAFTTAPSTLITNTSSTASLFTVNSLSLLFSDLALQNTSGVTPTAGSAGITVTSANLNQSVSYQNITVGYFNIDIDVQVGSNWSMHNAVIIDPVLYGLKIRNTVNADAGDWSITNSAFYTDNRTPTSAIRMESSGGGKIVNLKVNRNGAGAGGNAFVNGIDVAGIGNTIDLFVANSSIENFSGAGIKVSGSWPQITLMGLEIGSFAPGAVNAILLANTSNVVVSGILISTGFSGTPISLTSCTSCYVSNVIGTTPFSGGTKPDHDGTGGIGTFYLADGTVSSESRINWNIPVGQFGEFRIIQDPTTTNRGAAFRGENDLSNIATFQATGSTVAAPLANKAVLMSTGAGMGVTILTDSGVATGGTDDVSVRAGGTAQEVLLASHTGHIAMSGGGNTAPTLTAGCSGAGSVVSGSDANGTITGSTAAATTCTLSFGTAYSAAPNCAITGLSSPLTGAITVGTGSIQVNFTSTANYKWSYICHGT